MTSIKLITDPRRWQIPCVSMTGMRCSRVTPEIIEKLLNRNGTVFAAEHPVKFIKQKRLEFAYHLAAPHEPHTVQI